MKNKVITFEASILNRENMTGVDYYTRNLIEAIQKKYSDDNFELLFIGFKKPNEIFHKNGASIKSFRFMPGRLYSFLMRYNIAPPIDLLCMSKGDVYIFPNFERWPLFRRKPSMVIIYDLSFIKASQYASPRLVERLKKSVPRSIYKSQRIISISKNTKQEIVDFYGVDESRISVVYPAVDHKLFYPRAADEIRKVKEKYNIKGNYILSLGTIEPRKNLLGIMRSYEGMPQKLKNEYSLVLAGGKGWMDEEINSTLSNLSKSQNINQIGYVDEEDLPALYSGASLFVYPSFYEGWGMPIQEAMACGTPVVTANNSSLPESGGDAAIYANAADINSISKGIEKVLNNRSLSKELVEKGLLHVSNFTWEKSAKQLMDAIEMTIKEKR